MEVPQNRNVNRTQGDNRRDPQSSTRPASLRSTSTASSKPPSIPQRSPSLRSNHTPSNTSSLRLPSDENHVRRSNTGHINSAGGTLAVYSRENSVGSHAQVASATPRTNPGKMRMHSTSLTPSRRNSTSGGSTKDSTNTGIPYINIDFNDKWYLDLNQNQTDTDKIEIIHTPTRTPTVIRRKNTTSRASRRTVSRRCSNKSRRVSSTSGNNRESDQFSFVRRSNATSIDLGSNSHQSALDQTSSRRSSVRSAATDASLSVYSQSVHSMAITLASYANEEVPVLNGAKAWTQVRRTVEDLKIYKKIEEMRKKHNEIPSKFDRTKEDVTIKAKRQLNYAKTLMHDILQSSYAMLRNAGAWGYTFMPVAMLTVYIWDALQLVHDNSKACDSVIRNCANSLSNAIISIKLVIGDDKQSLELIQPVISAVSEKLLSIHEFVLSQSNRNVLVRFIDRKDYERTITSQSYRIDKEVSGIYEKLILVNLSHTMDVKRNTEMQLKLLRKIYVIVEGKRKELEKITDLDLDALAVISKGSGLNEAKKLLSCSSLETLAETVDDLIKSGDGMKKAFDGLKKIDEKIRENDLLVFYIDHTKEVLDKLKKLEEDGLDEIKNPLMTKQECSEKVEKCKKMTEKYQLKLGDTEKKLKEEVREEAKERLYLQKIYYSAQVCFFVEYKEQLPKIESLRDPNPRMDTIRSGGSDDEQ